MIDSNKDRIFQELTRIKPKSVLELGPHNGRDTVALACLCQKVVTIEGRSENVISVRKRIKEFGVRNIKVLHKNIENFELSSVGSFDLVWASGIIYHMPQPWRLIERITKTAPICLGWTHLADKSTELKGGYYGMNFMECDSPLAGFSPTSFWFKPEDFLRCWYSFGWDAYFLTTPSKHHNGGLAAQFIAKVP